jgi:hypothetical protein
MSDYRAYLIGNDGHIFQAMNLDVPDDAAAIAAALQLVDGHDVELWQAPAKSRSSSASKNPLSKKNRVLNRHRLVGWSKRQIRVSVTTREAPGLPIKSNHRPL